MEEIQLSWVVRNDIMDNFKGSDENNNNYIQYAQYIGLLGMKVYIPAQLWFSVRNNSC